MRLGRAQAFAPKFRAPPGGTPAPISAAVSVTLAAFTISAAGAVLITGANGTQLADVTISSAAKALINGALAVQLADVASTGSGTLKITGAASVTLESASLSAYGFSGTGINGTFASTLADVTISAASLIAVPGVFNTSPPNKSARLGYKIDAVPTRRLGARTK